MKAPKLNSLNFWPVVQRELREGARRPVNHRLRFWSVAAGTLLLWINVSTSERPAAQMGGWLFASLHTMLLGLILLIVPGLTADCIAREKREGTLGLLFLTPLSAVGIVAGKALAQGLRPAEEAGRWGDDEFLIISHERTAEMLAAHAQALAGMARTADFRWWGDRVSITVSIGAAQACHDRNEGLAQLLESAQNAMESSIHAGGNCITSAAGGQKCLPS